MRSLLVLAVLAAAGDREGFDKDRPGGAPAGFSAFSGKWTVEEDASAPSGPNVLVQSGEASFPLLLRDGRRIRDGHVRVSFRPVRGREDQAGGIAFRAADEKNYYVVRANALENNVCLYRMKEGVRELIAEAKAEVRAGAWQVLEVAFAGSLIRCALDGRMALSVRDKTFAGAGCVGLWTKADSVTRFDDFEFARVRLSAEALRALPGEGSLFAWMTRVAVAGEKDGEFFAEIAALFERLGDYDQAARYWEKAGKTGRRELCEVRLSVLDALDGGLRSYGAKRRLKNVRDLERALEGAGKERPILEWLVTGKGEGERLVGGETDDARILLLQGAALERARKPAEAAKVYGKILAADPRHVEAQLRAGHLAWRGRDLDRARRHAGAVRMLSPGSARPLILLGRVDTAAGETDAALARYDEALRLEPDCVAAMLGRGTTFFWQGIFRQAAKEYGRAIDADPDDPRGYYNRALARERLRDRSNALDDLRAARRRGPDLPQVHYDYARMIAGTGDLRAAEESFRKAVEVDPAFAPAMAGMGWIMRYQEDHEASREWYERATKTDPALPDAWGGLGNAYSKLKKWKEAVDAYTRALELRPGWTVVRVNRGMALFERKQFRTALKDFEQSLREQPSMKELLKEWIEKSKKEADKDY